MKRFVYATCISWALIISIFSFQPNPFLQLLMMVFSLVMFVSFFLAVIYIKRFWARVHWHSLAPLSIWLIVLVVPAMLGKIARDAYFYSVIPDLEEEILEYGTTGVFPETEWDGYLVRPKNMDSGEAVVEFWWGRGFPVKHTALVYCAVDSPLVYFKESGWGRGHELQENWWVVGD